MKRLQRKRDRWGQRDEEAERQRALEEKGSERAAVPEESHCCFPCVLSVGSPPVSTRQMQLGALGNYRDKPPSEHMCFSPDLHSAASWPLVLAASRPRLNNRRSREEEAEERRERLASSAKFRRRRAFSESHQPEVRAARLWPLGYRAGLRRTPLLLSTGVCGSRRWSVASCKFQISLGDHEHPPALRICIYLRLCAPAK